ncbi:hypothetical protein PQQ99_32010 [Paraburkholderia sediminicola]|uniref:hypothetical protein n=1 Tax=Paraburkholderia sediminicola TaxID=458836 RepID=UPI0038BDC546
MAAEVERFPAVRDLYRAVSSGKLYRVVYADRGAQDIVLCHIFGSRLDLWFIALSEFRTRSAAGYTGGDRLDYVKPQLDPYGRFRRNSQSTPGNAEQSAINWQRIKEFVEDPKRFCRALYKGSDRTTILQEIADTAGITIQRIRKLHREYMQRGMNEDAVSGELWRCGRRHQPPRYIDGENVEPIVVARRYRNRPGRKPSRKGTHAARTEPLERLFEQYIDIYITSRVGPWKLEVSDELMEEIRRFNREATFPSRRPKRKSVKMVASAKGRRPNSSKAGKRRRVIWQDLVDHLNYVCRCVRTVRDTTGQIVELELAPHGIVSKRQLTYYYKTRVPVEVRKCRTMGAKEYAARGRPIRGHALQHSVGPGLEFMIDATIADIFLVLAYDRTVIVGRPTVYLAMDVWSRMVVGFYVSYDPPAFESVALMLENIAMPKELLCARYGIKIDRSLWPCEYLPTSGFVADRGSDFMKTATWQAVNKELATPISNVKAWDPTLRALMERRFAILPAYYQRASYGIVEADAATRGAPHYAWDAKLTIAEFTRRLVRAILRYNQTPIGRRNAVPEMVAAGLADTPLNRWYWGMENLSGSLRSHSIEEIRCATWPTDTALPTRHGLEWRGAYYTSPFIESELIHCWGKAAKQPVPVRFNPNDPSTFILAGATGLEYAKPAATNVHAPSGETLMEWQIYRDMNARTAREQHDALESQRVIDLLNNAEESQAARDQQKAALTRARLDHPTRQSNRASQKPPTSATIGGGDFGNFRIGKDKQGKGGEGKTKRDNSGHPDQEKAGIIEKALENTRKILDGS